MTQFDVIEKPKHYNDHPSGVQAIEICEHLDFCLGNAIKYLWRAGKKPGQVELGSDSAVEDLKKSAWYLRRAIGKEYRSTGITHSFSALTTVMQSEACGSVLRDVLELIVAKRLVGDPPRVADALFRVERELAKRGQ
jgi:hypothetical protein